MVVDSDRLRLGTSSGGRGVPGNQGLIVSRGSGLGGKVLATGRPAAVGDYLSARSITHHYDGHASAEGLCAVLAVPVMVGRTVRGVLYGATRERITLGDRALSTAVEVGRELEQALAVQEQVDGLVAEARSALAVPSRRADVAWDPVREVHAELRTLAARLNDIHLKERIHMVCSALAAAYEPEDRSRNLPVCLSPREVDVLAGVAAGRTNPDIADMLGVGLETVKSYLRSVMRKLGTRTRLEAVTAARRAGLLP
ncbi:helix-turn-helix transcriptional regulator [Streptomyces phyllanthi]